MVKLPSSLGPSLRASFSTPTRSSPPHSLRVPIPTSTTRSLSSSAPRYQESKNRIYTPIRNPASLHETILLSTSSRIPLITYWSASYCPPCKTISPLLNRIVSSPNPSCPADPNGKIGFAEVEFDAPDIMGSSVPMDFMVTSLPSLLVFDRGEVVERVSSVRDMSNEAWVREWIERQARRGGEGSSGTGGPGIFGGLFSKL